MEHVEVVAGEDDGWEPEHQTCAVVAERCRRLLGRVPRATISHWTAVVVHGLPAPPATRSLLHVTVPRGLNVPRRRGVVGHRARVVDRVTVAGLPVTPVTRTWCDVAAAGASREELLVLTDALWRLGLAEPEELRHRLQERSRRAGSVNARWVLEWCDRRSVDADESRLRGLLLARGVRPPAVGHEVGTPTAGGTRLALAWPALRVGVRVVRRPLCHTWAGRVLADARLREQGWVLVDVPDVSLARPSEVLARVRGGLRLGRAMAAADRLAG